MCWLKKQPNMIHM